MLTEHYPGEPRKRRRSMATALAKKWYKSGGSLEAEAPALGAGSREFDSRPPDQSS